MYFEWDCFPDGKLPFELAQENQKKKRGKEFLYCSEEVSKLRGGTALLRKASLRIRFENQKNKRLAYLTILSELHFGKPAHI